MKKHFRFLSKSVLASVAISSAAVSCGLILSSCTNTNSDDNNNDNSGSNEIKIEDQSPDTHELDSGLGLTLYVNVQSNKPVIYQWFVDKNNNSGWTSIKDATESSYSIPSDSTQNITTTTTWKYKVEIYDADDANIKLTSNIYTINIKPQSTTPNPNPKPDPNPTPNPNPKPDPNPSPTPPVNPDINPSTSIDQNSISLKDSNQLLPSQYLSNLSNATLNNSLIIEKFDKSKIANVSYSVSELDDRVGTLKILMNYTENKTKKSYTFTFNNLSKLESSGYNLEFINAAEILNLSAQDISNKSINNKSEFEAFIKELEQSNIEFKFKNKGNELPLEYLNFNSVDITGFGTNWFTTNEKLVLTFTFKSPKINYYIKTAGSNITSNSFDYPTNKNKKATMEFYSAADYLLNQITNNSSYSTNEYAAYYYYDINYNDAFHAQVKISESFWLDNVTNELSYKNKNYTFRPILNKNSASSKNGSLTINLSMKYEGNDSSNVISRTNKDIVVTGFATYNQNNLFFNSGSDKGKFSLGCEAYNYDSNIKRLKFKQDLIVKKIDKMANTDVSVDFTPEEFSPERIQYLINSLICKFSGIELTANKDKSYYYNNLTAIAGFNIDKYKTVLRYNKTHDVFQLVISDFSITGVGVGSEDYSQNSETMIVNITHPNKSLENLKKSNI